MRRALFFLLTLPIGLPALAQSSAARWPVSAAVSNGRLEVSWSQCPEGAREWEAFLSLDGGRSFPIRVTPHLSTAVRSFSWPIPRLLSEKAKLRVRFGGAETEREYDVERGFPLRPAPWAFPLTSASRDVGKRASAGEEQTTAWVEGGSASPRTVAPVEPPGFHSTSQWRGAYFAASILPARRLAAGRPFDITALRSRSIEPTSARAVARDAPSLSRLSRLNV